MKRSKRGSCAKKGRARNCLAVLVLLVCAGAAAFLCLQAVRELSERQAGNGYYQALSGALHAQTTAPEPTPSAAVSPEPSGSDPAATEPGPSPEASATPEPDAAPASAIDFAQLRLTCPDAVGWISLPGTSIDYPVVQGEDNEYYLSHLPDGQANAAGSIMLDAACDGLFGDELNILHGHHMKNGSMFGCLDAFRDEAFYPEHSTLRLMTPQGDCDVALFAAFTTDGEAFGYPTAFDSDEAFDAFLAQCRARSFFRADVEVRRGDRLLLLSTCSYAYEGERLLVVGKLMQ